MSITAVLGCLYGDEAKAKMVDVLAVDSDIIIRFQGGSNAGHTVYVDDKKYVMHLIPSGIFHSDKVCVLASGVVIDPAQLKVEMDTLSGNDINFSGRFFIDERAAVVLPIHKYLDNRAEELHGDKKIGTTKRGIGPCYSDIVSRVGVRMNDLAEPDSLHEKIQFLYDFHDIQTTVSEVSNQVAMLTDFYHNIKDHVVNLPYMVDDWVKNEKRILFEGAQGTLLDVYFGTYPYVTSSHTVAGGISIAVGISPRKLDSVIGVMKSYFTRVGEGPFPTELHDEVGEQIRRQGHEFGSTTGRPRRCGWFDIVAARYSIMINGVDTVVLTLLDVLSGIGDIRVCIGYTLPCGEKSTVLPTSISALESVTPDYIELPGWTQDITMCRSWDDLPINAQKYVAKIEELLQVPVSIISVGPRREQTIFREKK